VLLALLLLFPDITKLKIAILEFERSTIPQGQITAQDSTSKVKVDEYRQDIARETGGQI